MSRGIRINARQCLRDGWRVFRNKPAIPLGFGIGLSTVMVASMLLIPDTLWLLRPVTTLILLAPLLSAAQIALYDYFRGDSVGASRVVESFRLRNWAVSALALLLIAGIFAATLAFVLLPQLGVSMIIASFALGVLYPLIGVSPESSFIGIALTASLFLVPTSMIALGCLLAPLHTTKDGVGPIAALRRSWDTTYGSKRRLMRVALPFYLAVIGFVLTGYLPSSVAQPILSILEGVSILLLLGLGLVLGPWVLSACVAGYVDLERQRAEEKQAAFFGSALNKTENAAREQLEP
jgi:hypothetical protein